MKINRKKTSDKLKRYVFVSRCNSDSWIHQKYLNHNGRSSLLEQIGTKQNNKRKQNITAGPIE